MIDRDKVARAILRAEGSDISDTDEVADYHLPAADAAAALARTKRAIEELAATLDEVDAFRDE